MFTVQVNRNESDCRNVETHLPTLHKNILGTACKIFAKNLIGQFRLRIEKKKNIL